MARRRDMAGRIGGRARPAGAAWLLAMLALLTQAFLPAAAMAAQSRAGGERMVICTALGAQTVEVADQSRDGDEKGFAGLPCQDCLAASIAALPAPGPQARPVVYAAARAEHGPERSWRPQLARAPPRPPGQGPPHA